MAATKLTEAQRRLIRFAGRDGCFIHRGEVRTARALERMGLALLEDNGRMRCNDERWYFTPNDSGLAALAASRSTEGR